MTVPPHGYGPMIREAAAGTGVDPLLLEALVWQESAFKADGFRWEPEFWARYCAGKPEWEGWIPRRVASSYGLCQIMYPTAKEAGYVGAPEGLFVPETNLALACKILANLLSWAEGREGQVLAAWNGGKGNWRAARPTAYARATLGKREILRSAARSPRPDRQ